MKKKEKFFVSFTSILFSFATALMGLWLINCCGDSLATIEKIVFGTIFSATPCNVIIAINYLSKKEQ